MDGRRKTLLAIAGAGIAALGGLAFYTAAEPEADRRQRPKSIEEERIEGLVDLMATNGMATVESTAPRPAPPIPVPLPETEAFDIGGAVTRHRRSADLADGAGYYDCDGDCTGQGVGMTMDGAMAPMPGDGVGDGEERSGLEAPGFEPAADSRSAPEPAPEPALEPRAEPQ